MTSVFRLMAALAGAGLLGWWGPAATAQPPARSPEVTHTARGPTGYAVTFRYADPAAKRVQIRGDWRFARPSQLSQIAGTPDHPIVEGQGLSPDQWRPGDFVLPKPNGTGGAWPLTDMVKGADGVWTYTTPLPSGIFSYSFSIDCADPPAPPAPAPAPCRRIADPGNLPWNESGGAVAGSKVLSSQVFVPSDAAFNTVDYAWQGPARARGKLTLATYAAPGHPAGQNRLVVYTPPGYDPARAKPYPTLYLSHGGGGNEMDWSTQGAAGDILDNLINSGQIEPLIMVMPNAGGFPTGNWYEAYDRDLIDRMIPLVEAKYHVSKSAVDRAFSGLSGGGMLTNTFMLKYPQVFQYYGMMSAGLPAQYATLTPEQVAGLKGKVIWMGGGWQDVIHEAGFALPNVISHTGPARQISTFAKAGIPVTTTFVHGGHQWYVWRLLLKDFLTKSAFLPAPYANW